MSFSSYDVGGPATPLFQVRQAGSFHSDQTPPLPVAARLQANFCLRQVGHRGMHKGSAKFWNCFVPALLTRPVSAFVPAGCQPGKDELL